MERLLDSVIFPADLKKLPVQALPRLSHELRQFIISTVSGAGGHLASSLGAVEIAVALHYVLNAPEDKIVWDVGHQAYAHKILTGRRAVFSTLRQMGGISGFPRPAESVYDAFGVGHSSTSISAALGMASAR
ncbi:1-deoxy-D-xylulose-5-phosphate synthase, partial [bacterium]